MAKILMVVARERFRDEELFVPRREFTRRGHKADIASTARGKCRGSRGKSATATVALSDCHPDGYDAVVFVGGGGSKALFADADALRIARQMNDRGKVVAAICLAPVILANAGVLKGKKATVAGTQAKTLEAAGAIYTGPGVTVDGTIVTGNAPKASQAFAEAVSALLNAG